MRWSSTPPPELAEAVSRRMATLSDELAAVRREQPVLPEPPEPVDPPPPGPARVAVPEPGRHASRRPSRGPAGGWPTGLPGRVPLSGVHVAVLALVVGVALAATAWLVLAGRARPEPLPEVAPVATSLVPSAPGTADGAAAPGSGAGPGGDLGGELGEDLVVDVAGKVRRPGIVELPPGSRVVDALEAAGGPRAGVALTSLNLARPLVDGEQILVGVPAPQAVGAAAAPGTGTAGPLVNLNTADLTTLETLPGVGPVTAQAIVDWRTEHGGFTAVEELLEVDGIGDATLADLVPHVTV